MVLLGRFVGAFESVGCESYGDFLVVSTLDTEQLLELALGCFKTKESGRSRSFSVLRR